MRWLYKETFISLLVALLCSPLAVDNLLAQGICSATARSYTVGMRPVSIAVGDFNGDSIQDLAVANQNSGNLSVLFGNGDGTFQAARNLAVAGDPFSVAVGDFNGDKILDLAVSSNLNIVPYRGTVSVLLGRGDGTFQAAQNFTVGVVPSSIAVGDFNRDGIQDLATANYGNFLGFPDTTVSILLGNGDGTFRAAQNFQAGTMPVSIAVGDFNRDGIQDLVVANENSSPCCPPLPGTVSILLGNGDGTFRSPQSFRVGLWPESVIVGDFNLDGIQDLATANQYSSDVSILLGNGDGTFRAAQNLPISGGAAGGLTLGDFNQDGRPDLAVSSNGAAILLGNGDGTFQAPQYFQVPTGPRSLTVGDFNGDSLQDLAMTSSSSSNVYVLLLGYSRPNPAVTWKKDYIYVNGQLTATVSP